MLKALDGDAPDVTVEIESLQYTYEAGIEGAFVAYPARGDGALTPSARRHRRRAARRGGCAIAVPEVAGSRVARVLGYEGVAGVRSIPADGMRR